MRKLVALLTAIALCSGVASANSPLSGAVVACSAGWPSWTVGCYVERPVVSLAGFSAAVGVDARVVGSDLSDSHLAPYLLLAYDEDTWGLWAQVAMPRLRGVPLLGNPDTFIVGMRYEVP